MTTSPFVEYPRVRDVDDYGDKATGTSDDTPSAALEITLSIESSLRPYLPEALTTCDELCFAKLGERRDEAGLVQRQ